MPDPSTMTATIASVRMMHERGSVIISFPNGEALTPGWRTSTFANRELKYGLLLEIEAPTDRAEWDRQVLALFGDAKYDKNPHAPGETYYRCKLIGANGV